MKVNWLPDMASMDAKDENHKHRMTDTCQLLEGLVQPTTKGIHHVKSEKAHLHAVSGLHSVWVGYRPRGFLSQCHVGCPV